MKTLLSAFLLAGFFWLLTGGPLFIMGGFDDPNFLTVLGQLASPVVFIVLWVYFYKNSPAAFRR